MTPVSPAQSTAPDVWRVVVVIFDNASLGTTALAFSVFDMASHYGAMTDVDIRVVSGEPHTTLRGGGLAYAVPYDLRQLQKADLIIVPGWQGHEVAPPELLLEALRGAHEAGARVVGLCGGVFVLAAAGLLDDRPATTHWMFTELLAERYPSVHVQDAVLYVDDGDVLTAGGGAIGVDLCLHLIRNARGAAMASLLARHMGVPPYRAGDQAQCIGAAVPEPGNDDPVSEAMTWALERLDHDLPVDVLARQAGMSRRNFDRRFREVAGTPPATWLIHQRVLRAQRLLESTRLPIDEIARLCGFSSAAALRPHFRRITSTSPAAYRSNFEALA